MGPDDEGWVPEACTLPTVERPLRVAEFDELLMTGLPSGAAAADLVACATNVEGPIPFDDPSGGAQVAARRAGPVSAGRR